jgi:hypothetical protein
MVELPDLEINSAILQFFNHPLKIPPFLAVEGEVTLGQ